jgi:hypothetical protein
MYIEYVRGLFYYCRDVLQLNCLATRLGAYCYSNGLPIIKWLLGLYTESLPSNDYIPLLL